VSANFLFFFATLFNVILQNVTFTLANTASIK